MSFRITGLDPAPFKYLVGVDDAELAACRARRVVATGDDGLPDRISLREARAGESLLLVNYQHHGADNPFRASHAVFIVEDAESAGEFVNEVPAMLRTRLLSIRAFDTEGMMIDADVAEGSSAEILIERMFASPDASFLHIHSARRGCYLALAEREI